VSAQPIMTTENSWSAILDWMAKNGQSVLLNYGEDNGAWECSWIVGYHRYTGISSRRVSSAIYQCLSKAGIYVKANSRSIDLADIYRLKEPTADPDK